jgi:SAM-dependent methyltransferase
MKRWEPPDMAGGKGLRGEDPGSPRCEDWQDCYAEEILARAASFFGSPCSAPLLDLGCSGGNRSSGLDAGGAQRYGLDTDLDALRVARSRYGSALFVCGDMRRLPFRSGTFGSLFCYSAMQYVDRESALGEARRVLGTRGRFAVAENSKAYPLTAFLDCIRSALGRRSVKHLGRSEKSLYFKYFRTCGRSGHHVLSPLAACLPVLGFVLFGGEIPARPGPGFKLLSALDRLLLGLFPGLGASAWMQLLLLERKDG